MENLANYLADIKNPEQRQRTEGVFRWILNKYPNLETRLAWNQPMFTDHGTFILGFSISRQHLAVAPETAGLAKFADEIDKAGYSRGLKIFRIKWEDAVDYDLLSRIIEFNMQDKADCKTFWRK